MTINDVPAQASVWHAPPTLSVIVPMYNVQDYVVECLRSLTTQLTAADLEIVVVDDAATDESMARVAAFLPDVPDAAIRVVRHEENQGLGEARRTGFAAATGKFIWCLDADDLAAPGVLHRLVDELRVMPADTVLQFRNYALVDAEGHPTGQYRKGIRSAAPALTTTDYVRLFLRGEASPNVTNKVFPRSAVAVSDFSPRRIWEDNPTMIALMSRVARVQVSDLVAYRIRERATSIMRSDTQLRESRMDLAMEVSTLVRARFGDVFDLELPYYLLNAGVMEDVLTVVTRAARLQVACRRVRALSRGIGWSAVARAFELGKRRTAFVAIGVKLMPELATLVLRLVMMAGPWRR